MEDRREILRLRVAKAHKELQEFFQEVEQNKSVESNSSSSLDQKISHTVSYK